jgi:hypothetical protein
MIALLQAATWAVPIQFAGISGFDGKGITVSPISLVPDRNKPWTR